MALRTDGLASGLQAGFQMGSNFFDRIEERKIRSAELERQKKLDQRADEEFRLKKEIQGYQLKDLRRTEEAKNKWLQLNPKVQQLENGTLPAEERFQLFTDLGLDPKSLVDKDNAIYKGAVQARNAFAGGEVNFDSPELQEYFQFRFGQRLQERSNGVSRNGEPITDLKIVGLEPAQGRPDALVPILQVTDLTGQTYTAPMTDNGSADPNDTVTEISMDNLIPKVMADETLMRTILSDDQVVSLAKNQIRGLEGQFSEFNNGFMINPLSGEAKYIKPTTPKNPTEATLAVAAANGDVQAQKALAELRKLKAQDNTAEAEILRDTERFKVQVKALQNNANTATEELKQLNEQIADLANFERELNNLQLQGSGTGALAGYRSQALAIARDFGFDIDEAELASLQSLEAINARLVLAGMGAIKGVASESDRAYVEASTASLTNSVEANRRIIMYRKGELMKQMYAQKAIQNASVADINNPAEGLKQQALAQQLILDVPSTGVVLDPNGELRPMSLVTFIEAKRRSTPDFYGQSGPDQNRQMGQWFAEWTRMTQEGLNAQAGI